MELHENMLCPKCLGKHFTAKYETTYVYSYKIDLPSMTNTDSEPKDLPFLFDNREQKGGAQYLECDHCKSRFPCEFTMGSDHVDFTILQKAVRGNYVKNIEFWG